MLATKDHVNVFLYDGAIVPDPEGIITGGHDNKTARTVAIYEGETLNAAALRTMFEQIIANNRAGGWRQLKTRGLNPPVSNESQAQAAACASAEGLWRLTIAGAS